MEAYSDMLPMWDLSQATNFSQLPDDDFLAILQKQFPSSDPYTGFTDGVNPQNISRYSLPSLTPPSEDSSPSPPGPSNMQSFPQDDNDDNDHDLKRKASEESLDDEPNQKNQHTSSNSNKKGGSTRRKSAGGNGDDNRLLKRKEQNRAAQRAFRERKEKHVKDLEDQVAALEAKNEQTTSENVNLRDLLSRVQTENLALKQSSFTFSVPKTAEKPASYSASSSYSNSPENNNIFSPVSSSASSSTTPAESGKPSPQMSVASGSFDWGSLTSFDPTILNLLDESPQVTATDGAMQMDFGFGKPGKTGPYTTIASNPNFMSFASSFESPLFYDNDNNSGSTNANINNNNFGFDISNSTLSPSLGGISPWTGSPSGSSLDDLFSPYMAPSSVDFNSFTGAVSPVIHRASPGASSSSSFDKSNNNNNNNPQRPNLFSTTISPKNSNSPPSLHNKEECPKGKAETAARIQSHGPSPFAPSATSFLQAHSSQFGASTLRKDDSGPSSVVMCQGSSFPPTKASDDNVEVLTAWRSIMNNPQFKDADINELCTEFSSKARCDGTKVVLEPQGVNHIIEQLSHVGGQKSNNQ